MASLNKVYLLGNLTRDPDLRSLPSGQSVCEIGLAVGRRYVNSSGQEVEDTCFVDVVVWGRSAANCKQYLEKGSQVLVEGRLQLDQWEDRNGGGKRSRLRVVAEQIQFLNRRGDGGNAGGAPAYGNGGGNNYGGAPAYGNGGATVGRRCRASSRRRGLPAACRVSSSRCRRCRRRARSIPTRVRRTTFPSDRSGWIGARSGAPGES